MILGSSEREVREGKAGTAWGMSWHPLPPHRSAGRGVLAGGGEGELTGARITLSILWFHCPCCLVARGSDLSSRLWDGKP